MASPPADYVVRHLLRPLAGFLEHPEVTELAVNRPGELWAKAGARWTRHEVPALAAGHLQALATALIAYNPPADPADAVVALVLPGGERGQLIRPPACVDGQFSLTIRKHMIVAKSLEELAAEGVFDDAQLVGGSGAQVEDMADTVDRDLLEDASWGLWDKFLRCAVQARKNIVIAGSTGSGKTTLARSLIQWVPTSERVVTLEDVHELALPEHPNRLHLLYGGPGRPDAQEMLRQTMRLNPDRIFLSELRGDEAWDYVSSCNTGHPGSITTVHANSAQMAFARIAQLVKQSPVGRALDPAFIHQTLRTHLDVVVFMQNRRVTEVFFDPVAARALLS